MKVTDQTSLGTLTCSPPSGPSLGCGSCASSCQHTRTALVVSEIQAETGVGGSTLSHHLEKLKNDELVTAEREKAFIRYRANTEALEELLGFLYAECCTRNKAVEPRKIAAVCK